MWNEQCTGIKRRLNFKKFNDFEGTVIKIFKMKLENNWKNKRQAMTCGVPSGGLINVQLKFQENRGKGNERYLRKWWLNFFKSDEIHKLTDLRSWINLSRKSKNLKGTL